VYILLSDEYNQSYIKKMSWLLQALQWESMAGKKFKPKKVHPSIIKVIHMALGG